MADHDQETLELSYSRWWWRLKAVVSTAFLLFAILIFLIALVGVLMDESASIVSLLVVLPMLALMLGAWRVFANIQAVLRAMRRGLTGLRVGNGRITTIGGVPYEVLRYDSIVPGFKKDVVFFRNTAEAGIASVFLPLHHPLRPRRGVLPLAVSDFQGHPPLREWAERRAAQ